jgi:anti-sigma factor RsiW
MMTCCRLLAFLMDYLDGGLSAAERAEFEAHLARCPPCVAYLQTYQDAILLCKSAHAENNVPPLEPMPEELVQAILAARAKGGT